MGDVTCDLSCYVLDSQWDAQMKLGCQIGATVEGEEGQSTGEWTKATVNSVNAIEHCRRSSVRFSNITESTHAH